MKISRTAVAVAATAALVVIPGAAFAGDHYKAEECSYASAPPEYAAPCPDDEDKRPTTPTPKPATTQKVIRTLHTQ